MKSRSNPAGEAQAYVNGKYERSAAADFRIVRMRGNGEHVDRGAQCATSLGKDAGIVR